MTPLNNGLVRLRQEFPDSRLLEVRLEFRMGERRIDGIPNESWSETGWTVQVGNNSECGKSLDEAVAKLHEEFAREAEVPDRAARIAAILREVPDERFARHHVLQAAQLILDNERSNRIAP